ncbi:MAG: metallophosphoesterase [Patescibacteria group bacterium]
MKIGIIGDVHASNTFPLGATDLNTQLNTRLLDFIKTFDGIIDEFEKRGVKLVAITGDTYDKKVPLPQETNILSKSFMRAVSKGMRILILTGNHDIQRASNTTSVDIFNSLNLETITSFPEFSVYTTQDESGQDINILFCPYRDKNSYNVSLPDQAISIIKEDVDKLKANLKGRIYAITHFMLNKTVTGQTSETFSLHELILPLSIFDGVDMVIGGHVHAHEILRKSPPAFYVGSMDRLTLGEKDCDKVSVVVDTTDNSYEIISNNVRDMFELDFDYSAKEFKAGINDKIVADVEEYSTNHKLDESIVKVVLKVKENDSHFVDRERVKDYIMAKKVNHLIPIQVSTVSTRTIRNKDITEDVSSKQAIEKFINGLDTETEGMKKRLAKIATEIIESVDGK